MKKIKLILFMILFTTFLNAATKLTTTEIKELAKQATIYAYPIVDSYRVMYAQAIDTGSSEFKAPFNKIKNEAKVAGPKDTSIQTINADTPYSYFWMDLREEAVVLTIPKIETNRYYSVQLVDSYTQNNDYIGVRKDGSKGGKFLVVGPKWKGTVPSDITRVIKMDTEFGYAIYRTQLFNEKDIDNVKKIQDGYKIQTLSEYLGEKPKTAAVVKWLPINREDEGKPEKFFNYLNQMFKFMPVYSDEKELRKNFEKIGIIDGKEFNYSKMSPQEKEAVNQGFNEGMNQIKEGMKKHLDVKEIFGTHEYLKNNYLNRAIAAYGGIYGNSKEEAVYIPYITNDKGEFYDTSKNKYTMHFTKDSLPPVKAFWSITMYDGKTLFMIENPLNRNLINSAMLSSLKKDKDGGITIYIQKDSPGKNKESNWLPAPNGPFAMMLRTYLPRESILNNQWQPPVLEIVK